MLPSEHRLRHSADFRRVLRQGRRSTSRTVVVHALPAAEGVRVGLAVNRSVGGAVVRNRVKRRLREAMRAQLTSLAASGSWDIVLRATPRAASATYADVQADLSAALAASSSAPRRPQGRVVSA